MAFKPTSSRRGRLAAHKVPLILTGIGLLLVVASLVFFLFWRGRGGPEVAGVGREPFLADKPLERRQVQLFFSSGDGEALVPEKREILAPAELREQVKGVLWELIKGPGSSTLGSGRLTQGETPSGAGPTIPQGVVLREVFLDPSQGDAYVDFSGELIRNHPGGSQTEALTVFSIVNTLTLNFPQIKKVQILIEGKEMETLAGHIFIQDPLGADRSWIEMGG